MHPGRIDEARRLIVGRAVQRLHVGQERFLIEITRLARVVSTTPEGPELQGDVGSDAKHHLEIERRFAAGIAGIVAHGLLVCLFARRLVHLNEAELAATDELVAPRHFWDLIHLEIPSEIDRVVVLLEKLGDGLAIAVLASAPNCSGWDSVPGLHELGRHIRLRGDVRAAVVRAKALWASGRVGFLAVGVAHFDGERRIGTQRRVHEAEPAARERHV
mmetsp:Transcript_218/g.910  ORF Transcript_218/g.910 Transcript_218/m.910 type:complete len:217 (+) Transcript_218:1325-1975(+)